MADLPAASPRSWWPLRHPSSSGRGPHAWPPPTRVVPAPMTIPGSERLGDLGSASDEDATERIGPPTLVATHVGLRAMATTSAAQCLTATSLPSADPVFPPPVAL